MFFSMQLDKLCDLKKKDKKKASFCLFFKYVKIKPGGLSYFLSSPRKFVMIRGIKLVQNLSVYITRSSCCLNGMVEAEINVCTYKE